MNYLFRRSTKTNSKNSFSGTIRNAKDENDLFFSPFFFPPSKARKERREKWMTQIFERNNNIIPFPALDSRKKWVCSVLSNGWMMRDGNINTVQRDLAPSFMIFPPHAAGRGENPQIAFFPRESSGAFPRALRLVAAAATAVRVKSRIFLEILTLKRRIFMLHRKE